MVTSVTTWQNCQHSLGKKWNICEIKKKNVANTSIAIGDSSKSIRHDRVLPYYIFMMSVGWIDQLFWTQNGVARWKQKVVLRFASDPFLFSLFIYFQSFSFSLGSVLVPFTALFGSLDKAAIRRRQQSAAAMNQPSLCGRMVGVPAWEMRAM